MNLSPSLGASRRQRRASRKSAKRYDCGAAGMLTIRQIMERSGLSMNTVYARIYKGVAYDALVLPKQPARTGGVPRSTSQLLACKMAAAFGRRIPSAKEVQALHPMSDGAAFRWVNAWRSAISSLPPTEDRKDG